MNEFIDHYSEAFKLFQLHGFKDPIIYRSIKGEPNPDKVLVLVNDMHTMESEEVRSSNRMWRLKCGLQKYFKPEVYVLTPDDFEPWQLQPILDKKDRPTLLLTEHFSSEEGKQLLEGELVKIFGGAVGGKSPLFKRATETSQTFFSESDKNTEKGPTVEQVIYLMQQLVGKAGQENAPEIVIRLKEEAMRLEAGVRANKLIK